MNTIEDSKVLSLKIEMFNRQIELIDKKIDEIRENLIGEAIKIGTSDIRDVSYEIVSTKEYSDLVSMQNKLVIEKIRAMGAMRRLKTWI